MQSDDQGEIWTRDFGGTRMRSRLIGREGLLFERLGPIRFAFALHANGQGIEWKPVSAKVLGLPLPEAWIPYVAGKESTNEGRYTFDVRVELLRVGLLIHYHGWLDVDD